MANCADCAIAIAKEDIKKLGGAIKRLDKNYDGVESKLTYDIYNDNERHNVVHYYKNMEVYSGKGARFNRCSERDNYYLVDNNKITPEEYTEKYAKNYMVDYSTHKCEIDKAISNGWEVDWQKLNSYSYEMDTQVQEYGDHITIYFGGRWSFPESLETLFNDKEVVWQGAEAETGCEVLNDELGNWDFGLRTIKERDEDGYLWYYVEDKS